MSQTAYANPKLLKNLNDNESTGDLVRQLLALSLPIMVENMLHMAVGITDTYMANTLPENSAAATAAIGTISYFIWFVGLIVAAVGTGATAIIARAKGARHRSLANSVCGQSVTASAILGLLFGIFIYVAATPLVNLTGLTGTAPALAHSYLRMLAFSMPFMTLMFVASASLRGAGDTITPAICMIVVDVLNMFLTYTLTRGAFGLPKMGFTGIATGTVIAYTAGGLLIFGVLLAGRGGIRLHVHRLWPHWVTLKRIFRIGIPSGFEGLLVWVAQFGVVYIINHMDATNRLPAAHINAVRIEGLSYMAGFAVATAAATMVGQSLGMRKPARATKAAYLSYALGASIMVACGVLFILAGKPLARIMSPHDAYVADMTARCLFITGFIQFSFASSAVFGGALRGAGDTFAVMVINLASILCLRLAGVLVVGLWLHKGLIAIWLVLSAELFVRGLLIYVRFVNGKWRFAKV